VIAATHGAGKGRAGRDCRLTGTAFASSFAIAHGNFARGAGWWIGSGRVAGGWSGRSGERGARRRSGSGFEGRRIASQFEFQQWGKPTLVRERDLLLSPDPGNHSEPDSPCVLVIAGELAAQHLLLADGPRRHAGEERNEVPAADICADDSRVEPLHEMLSLAHRGERIEGSFEHAEVMLWTVK
jgi:hypothetical protein